MAEVDAKTSATPGELLRSARQLYGLSVEEVADELNLLPYIIQALENDDYDQLAGWTYVVGYLRSYGKLVSVNVESAIKQHERFLPPAQDGPGTVTENVTHRQPIAIHYRWVVTAVVLIVVVGGLYGAYLKRSGDIERIDLASNELNDDLARIQKEPVPVDIQSKTTDKVESASNNDSTTIVATASTVAEKEESAGMIRVSESTMTDEKKLSDAESTVESGTDESQGVVGNNSAAVNSVQTRSEVPTSKQVAVRPATTDLTQSLAVKQKVSQARVLQTKVTPERSAINPIADTLVQTGFLAKVKLPPAESTPIRSGVSNTLGIPVDDVVISKSNRTKQDASRKKLDATEAEHELLIILKHDSHVEVRDRIGNRLVRQTFPAGKSISILGIPPFRVRLGVSEDVRVVYDGEPFSLILPRHGGSIRFSVGHTGLMN